MTSQKTIDIHAHVIAEETMRLMQKEAPKVGPTWLTTQKNGGHSLHATDAQSCLVGKPRGRDRLLEQRVHRVADTLRRRDLEE